MTKLIIMALALLTAPIVALAAGVFAVLFAGYHWPCEWWALANGRPSKGLRLIHMRLHPRIETPPGRSQRYGIGSHEVE